MRMLPATVLTDDAYRVPEADPGTTGLAWLRASVPRFSEGPAHARRRALVEAVLADLAVAPEPGGDPTVALLRAMRLPESHLQDVADVAAAYQPHTPQSAAADEAVERLLQALGDRSEETAARICVLVQAHAATRALAEKLRSGEGGPAVPATRRIGPDGETVEVDLTDAPFGRGRHACPGEDLARLLAAAVHQ